MTNSQDDRPDDADDPWAPDELERMIDNVQTADDFIEFVDFLAEELWQDEDFHDKIAVVFLRILARRLRALKAVQDPDDPHVPEQPNWQWLAGVFEMAAFEN